MGELDAAKIERLENEVSRLQRRVEELEVAASAYTYDDLPVSVLVEDFSAVGAHFAALRSSGVQDFRAHFNSHPEESAFCAALVKIVSVNQACAKLLGTDDLNKIPRDLPVYFDEESLRVFQEELIVLAEGGLCFEEEIHAFDLLRHIVKCRFQRICLFTGLRDISAHIQPPSGHLCGHTGQRGQRARESARKPPSGQAGQRQGRECRRD